MDFLSESSEKEPLMELLSGQGSPLFSAFFSLSFFFLPTSTYKFFLSWLRVEFQWCIYGESKDRQRRRTDKKSLVATFKFPLHHVASLSSWTFSCVPKRVNTFTLSTLNRVGSTGPSLLSGQKDHVAFICDRVYSFTLRLQSRICYRANLCKPPSICHIPLFSDSIIVIYVIIADNLVITHAAFRRLPLIDN